MEMPRPTPTPARLEREPAPPAHPTELHEDVRDVGPHPAAEPAAHHALVVVPAEVVPLAPLRVGEHAVRLDDELELLFVAALRGCR